MGKDKHEEESRRGRRNRRSRGGVADFAGANPDTLSKAIASICRTGGAIRFGYTQDGGAYAIGIYGDGDPYTDYVKPSEDINEYLQGLIEAYED